MQEFREPEDADDAAQREYRQYRYVHLVQCLHDVVVFAEDYEDEAA